MKVGTKSLLFGVHQFLWHPLTVGIAWRRLYGRWPKVSEWVCIFCHDLGYWGCPNMDGMEGRSHPYRGSRIVAAVIYGWHRLCGRSQSFAWIRGEEFADHTIRHSINYARLLDKGPSGLYFADKASVLIEPRWLYLLRARLSGEIWEYIDNSPFKGIPDITPADWLDWYRTVVRNKINESRLYRWPVSRG